MENKTNYDSIKIEEELLYLSIYLLEYKGKKIIEFRGQIHDKEKIEKILIQAFNNDDVPARIIIRDKFKAYHRSIEKGFLDGKKVKFLI